MAARQRAPRDPGGVQAPQQYQDALGLVHDGHRFLEVLDIGERFKCRVEFAANKLSFGNYCTCYEGGARLGAQSLSSDSALCIVALSRCCCAL